MSRKKDPALVVIEFFSTEPLERAHLMLQLVRHLLAKREAPKPKVVRPRAPVLEAKKEAKL